MSLSCIHQSFRVKIHPLLGRLAPGLTGSCCPPHQTVRWMSRKKQPNQATEKEKWVSRSAKESVKKKAEPTSDAWAKFQGKQPIDDVWIKTHYLPVKCTFADAVESFRELAIPEMLDNMDGFININAVLNMATSKKTKFIAEFEGVLTMPHYFDDGTENKVLAFCKTKEEARLALEEGAIFAGGSELVSLIESGEVKGYMFDNAVCTMEFLDGIVKARKHIRDKFPVKKQGSIGDDIVSLVRNFRLGKNYSCTKPSDSRGKISMALGTLNMPTEHLQENFKAFITKIHSHRPVGKTQNQGPFINYAYCVCPPSGEKMYLTDSELVSETLPPTRRVTSITEDVAEEEEEEEGEVEEAAASS